MGISAPSFSMNTAYGTTQGTTLYCNSGGWVSLSPGTSGQVLGSQGANADVHWVTGTNAAITLSGDLTGTGTTAITGTLATVNSNVGTFGSASVVPVVTVNGKGLVTAVTTANITGSVPTQVNDSNANAVILSAAATTPVNQITVTNAATTAAPMVSVTGTDSNIDLILATKGTGYVRVGPPASGNTTNLTPQVRTSGTGQNLQIASGSSLSGSAGQLLLTGVNSNGTGNGGNIIIQGGQNGAAGGTVGSITIDAGFGLSGTAIGTVAIGSNIPTNLTHSKAIADQSFSYQTPATGFTITIANNISTLILDPAGTLATGTITMPAIPINGQLVRITSTQIITALTVSPNSGQTISNAPSTIATAGLGFGYIYRTTGTNWFRLY